MSDETRNHALNLAVNHGFSHAVKFVTNKKAITMLKASFCTLASCETREVARDRYPDATSDDSLSEFIGNC